MDSFLDRNIYYQQDRVIPERDKVSVETCISGWVHGPVDTQSSAGGRIGLTPFFNGKTWFPFGKRISLRDIAAAFIG